MLIFSIIIVFDKCFNKYLSVIKTLFKKISTEGISFTFKIKISEFVIYRVLNNYNAVIYSSSCNCKHTIMFGLSLGVALPISLISFPHDFKVGVNSSLSFCWQKIRSFKARILKQHKRLINPKSNELNSSGNVKFDNYTMKKMVSSSSLASSNKGKRCQLLGQES